MLSLEDFTCDDDLILPDHLVELVLKPAYPGALRVSLSLNSLSL